MSLSTLLYVSTSVIPGGKPELQLRDIVDVARKRNTATSTTGALLFTGTNFAQVLEGDCRTLEHLMESIRADPRHKDVVICHQASILERRFGNWSMAYSGPSKFVERHVTRLLSDPPASERKRATEWLSRLMHEFAGSHFGRN